MLDASDLVRRDVKIPLVIECMHDGSDDHGRKCRSGDEPHVPDQREAAELCATDNDKFQQDWKKAYDKRTTLLKTFVDEYGLTVSPSCQDSLDKLVGHGKKVERDNNEKAAVESLAGTINLEFTEQYSTFTGQATVSNNTGYDFDYINFKVELFDANGVKVETTGLYANHWLNGETIVLNCYTSQKEAPATVKIVADGYEIADAS